MSSPLIKTRVGIITFHRAINYGALFQAYSLVKALESIGCDCEIIDYQSQCIDKNYQEMHLRNCKNIKEVLRFPFVAKAFNEKRTNFREFVKKNLQLSQPCLKHEDLEEVVKDLDILISGSDQVWNYNITDFDEAYVLGFDTGNLKKNSYAASFGVSKLSEKHEGYYQRFLQLYDHISVRERQGKEIVKKLLGKDVEVHLDPTFLLSREEWKQVANENNRTKNYILIYSFGLPQTLRKFSEYLSRNTGLPIIYLPVSSYSLRDRIKAEYRTTASPSEYLGLFLNASYVITNSFHGTAFSIIFNKPFFLEKKPASPDNSRFDNIMDTFSLREREIINGSNSNPDKEIDFKEVNSILEKEKERGILFLSKITSV